MQNIFHVNNAAHQCTLPRICTKVDLYFCTISGTTISIALLIDIFAIEIRFATKNCLNLPTNRTLKMQFQIELDIHKCFIDKQTAANCEYIQHICLRVQITYTHFNCGLARRPIVEVNICRHRVTCRFTQKWNEICLILRLALIVYV